jgi:predicted AAA+ superfamily ATPase
MFGARGTGKTTLLRSLMAGKDCLMLDLLDRETEDRLAREPGRLYGEIKALPRCPEWVVIDEIQKLPQLLDSVHRVLETHEFAPPKFALTGSSARKLRHGGANLLAGRAFVYNLYPLTHVEIGPAFDLDRALNFGTLPKALSLETPIEREEFLRSYGLTYLQEEVWAEHLIQELEPFRKFLEIAAQSNTHMINYAKVARDVGVHEKTVKKYFQILEDTLIGFMLEPFNRSVRKRQTQSPKFYLFDTGVQRALSRTLSQEIIPRTYAYGRAFEHFVIIEALRLNDYGRRDFAFSYLRTKDDVEVDLIVDRPGRPLALVEIKATEAAGIDDIRSLLHFKRDFKGADLYCLTRDPVARDLEGVRIRPWMQGLADIGLVS